LRLSCRNPLHLVSLLLAPAILVVAGCGGRVAASERTSAAVSILSIHATASHLDTASTTQYTATLPNGEPAKVDWSVAGGDPTSGPGSISSSGLYTPPNYLTQDAISVAVNASQPGSFEPVGTAELTVTPGFLQPLTPGNLALGASGSVTISGSMTEVGGANGIHFTIASDPSGTPSDAGALSTPRCTRGSVTSSNPAYTVCTVTYSAPAVIPPSGAVYIVGTIQSSTNSSATPAKSWTHVLLNAAGINSNPASHQAHLAAPIQLGSSSGSNADYDTSQGLLADCCGGTLGALVQDTSGVQYALSNNHVLARSDQSIPGETVIQPGLIDNGCVPYGFGLDAFGSSPTPVATLTGYPSLTSPTTNVDAAIARVTRGAIDTRGSILELGSKQLDGTLAAAPPGISSTGGKGETAYLGMTVAKSGRTTGLTCAAVSAISVDVTVDYFSDCAETSHAFSKTFTNQIAIAGPNFSDAGDSGALVVDTANAEPVGLFFAGGTDANGIEHAIANPASDVLSTLNSQVSGANGQTSYNFVGGTDHPVSCLNYGGNRSSSDTISPAAVESLSASEKERQDSALPLAQLLLNPATGVVRVAAAASKDHPGEAAIAFYTVEPQPNSTLSLPNSLASLPTVILPSNEFLANASPKAASLAQALAVKQRNAATLLKSDPAIFGVGVGQSLDSPADAAILLFVDRHKVAGKLPETIEGQRVRVLLMDRLHVTRSHGQPARKSGSCLSIRQQEPSEKDDGRPWNGIENPITLPE
jgi:hypothetical protein